MNGACNVKLFLAPPPGALGMGQKVKYHLISIKKSNSKILYQTLCVFSQMKDTKHIRRDFHFGLCGTRGTQGVKQFFFKHGHVAYQIDGDAKQNKMQITFSS